MRQGPHIQLTHAITLDGLTAGGEQVTGRDYRQVRAELCPPVFRQSGHGIVVLANPVLQLAFLVCNALAGRCLADVPIPQIGHGADNEFRFAIRACRVSTCSAISSEVLPTTCTFIARSSPAAR